MGAGFPAPLLGNPSRSPVPTRSRSPFQRGVALGQVKLGEASATRLRRSCSHSSTRNRLKQQDVPRLP
jgi:hypothetical protein